MRGTSSVLSGQPIFKYVVILKLCWRPRMSSAVIQCSACEPPARAMVRVACGLPYVQVITARLRKSLMQSCSVVIGRSSEASSVVGRIGRSGTRSPYSSAPAPG
ncbi:Uncharacterised protein [Mycobacteroides abscessus subsp. abscessus]|nr:Uncharacterised protein [Mycobacteroides abscessus subsp. abscessus]SHW45593.1 Uncharacterised protein [Mycobacteroides abscessus subsp. abscessus]